MKFRTLQRHFRESFKSLGRNGLMTFASVSAVTVTLTLVGVFFVILMNLNHIAENVENDVQVKAYLDTTADQKTIELVQRKLDQIKGVDTVKYSPKEAELEMLIEDMGSEGKVFELFEQDNPLRDAFIIQTQSPEEVSAVAAEVKKFKEIQSVDYGKDYVEKLFDVLGAARSIGIVLVVGLLFTAMFLISNTIKITIMARRKEIEIMRLVGATNTFIRWPFFLEGLWLGILGSIIPIGLIASFYSYLYDYSPQFQVKFMELLPINPFIYQISAILILLGGLIGIWGSVMSVRKFLKV